jgi:hypothetical protein
VVIGVERREISPVFRLRWRTLSRLPSKHSLTSLWWVFKNQKLKANQRFFDVWGHFKRYSCKLHLLHDKIDLFIIKKVSFLISHTHTHTTLASVRSFFPDLCKRSSLRGLWSPPAAGEYLLSGTDRKCWLLWAKVFLSVSIT